MSSTGQKNLDVVLSPYLFSTRLHSGRCFEGKLEIAKMLGESERGSENAGLKLNIQKTRIITSGPITSWQIDEKTMEAMTDFIFLGSRNTADGVCSHEIKSHLLLGRKAMTNLDSVLKSRDITLLKNVCLVKAVVSPVVMCGCER